MPDDQNSLTWFFQRLRQGDRDAAAKLWEHFCPRMLGLARKILDRRLSVLDAEDAAQSAFASFWQRAERGDFSDSLDRNELWRILATITARKARWHMTRELADKRGGGRVQKESELEGTMNGFRLDQALAKLPAPEFDLACEELMEELKSEELQTIALYRLMGYTNQEIAQMLSCSERKIERKLRLIRLAWQRSGEEPAP
jgi:RNA polymerase sigma factor (sigma-70 family)